LVMAAITRGCVTVIVVPGKASVNQNGSTVVFHEPVAP
jgi:hypothetical protein